VSSLRLDIGAQRRLYNSIGSIFDFQPGPAGNRLTIHLCFRI